jgi:hypothetical protein
MIVAIQKMLWRAGKSWNSAEILRHFGICPGVTQDSADFQWVG